MALLAAFRGSNLESGYYRFLDFADQRIALSEISQAHVNSRINMYEV